MPLPNGQLNVLSHRTKNFVQLCNSQWRSQWRSQGSGGSYTPPEKGKVPQKAEGHRRFVCLAAAYCLSSYSYDLLVSSDSDFYFLIEPQNQHAVHFYTLNNCLTFCYNAIYRTTGAI